MSKNETATQSTPKKVSPTVNCIEDHDFQVEINKAKHSCTTIRNRHSIRETACDMPEVVNACPITCGMCCADDSEYSFNTTLGRTINCAWIAEQGKASKFCDRNKNGRFVRDACAETCKSCSTTKDENPPTDDDYVSKAMDLDKGQVPAGLIVTFGFFGVASLLVVYFLVCKRRWCYTADDDIDILATESGSTKMVIRTSSQTSQGSSHGDENAFPKVGVKVSYFDEFVKHCGGRRQLKDMTTTQVRDKYVREMTLGMQLSLCDFLKEKKHESVGYPSVFISHVWQYEFLSVVDALQYHMRDAPDTIVWFDLFSINQHSTENPDFSWWDTAYITAIKEIGHMVMIVSPWNDRLALSRSWCLFEGYCAKVGKCQFEIALNQKDRSQLLKDMEDNPNIEEMIGAINIEKSESYRQQDKEMILRVIRESVGYRSANEFVFALVRRWLIDTAKQEVENHSEDEGRIWKLLHMLGRQFQGQGKLELSKQLLEKCLQQQKDTLGPTHPHTLSTLHELADLYCKLEMYDEAKTALEDVFLRRKATLGRGHQDTIGTLHNLAAVHLVQRDYNEAKRIYEEVLQIRISTLGQSHPLTLNTLSNLALLYKDNNEIGQAKKSYAKVLQLRKEVLGEQHPKTLSTLHNLASLYDQSGNQFEAKIMFENCLSQQREVLGESHPDTLGTMNNLAVLYHKEREYPKAEEMYEECLRHQKETLGEEHPDTLGTLHNLALLYENRENIDEF